MITEFKEEIVQRAKKELLDKIDKFLEERTFIKSDKEGTNISLIRFMPYEWDEFKKELE